MLVSACLLEPLAEEHSQTSVACVPHLPDHNVDEDHTRCLGEALHRIIVEFTGGRHPANTNVEVKLEPFPGRTSSQPQRFVQHLSHTFRVEVEASKKDHLHT